MGVGVLCFYEGKLLILKPTYRDYYLLPGGVIDQDESPREAAQRELEEEIGLKLSIKKLLIVDYLHPIGEKTECIQFIFQGAELTQQDLEAIKLQEGEVASFHLVPLAKALTLLDAKTSNRISKVAMNKETLYLENGNSVFP